VIARVALDPTDFYELKTRLLACEQATAALARARAAAQAHFLALGEAHGFDARGMDWRLDEAACALEAIGHRGET